ncbi:hypothetical protein OF83DRAFT_1020201, partial [Amylostereum chailletii]
FWGVVKKYLRDNCDYTFETLKQNMPKAMEAVKLETIHLWEHRIWRWVGAYEDGIDAKDTQMKVKEFSSKQYTFHCRAPETLARLFD